MNIWKQNRTVLLATTCASLALGLAYSATTAVQIPAGQKGKVEGSILSRNGDLVTVGEKRSGSIAIVNLTDSTKIERNKGKIEFRHQNMDVTAMVPGLTIQAEGVGNVRGQLDASKVTF